MNRVLVTPPTQEPLTLAEIARHLRLDVVNAEPAPDAPTVALASVGAGNVNNGAHRYLVTFVTTDGETEGGVVSDVATVLDKTIQGKVSLSGVPTGGAAVTARKIYRTAANGSSYSLLATIADNSTTTYLDNIADASLGIGAPTTNTTVYPELVDLLRRSRRHLESKFGRAFLTQAWRLTLDHFPCGSCFCSQHECRRSSGRENFGDTIDLPMPVLQTVTSITYVDGAGAVVTLPASVYDVDTDHFPGRVVLKYGQQWPIPRAQRNAVVITFVSGYADASLVPDDWKAALKLLIGHWYLNRGDTDVELPNVVDDLMWPDRFLEVA